MIISMHSANWPMDFIADIIESAAEPWSDKLSKKWKSRKRNKQLEADKRQ